MIATSPSSSRVPPGPSRSEAATALAIVVLGMGVRAAFVAVFPTRAMIDAYELIEFARKLADRSAFDHTAKSLWTWAHWNPGMPLFLAPFLAVFGRSDLLVAATARWVIAVTTGAAALAPVLVLRGVYSLRARSALGVLLAIWPGQVIFSGVVLQDNLACVATITLACMTVRSVALGTAAPVWAAACFAVGVAIRQEMLLTNLALAVVPLGLTKLTATHRGRVAGLALLAIAFLSLSALRWKATDRFALSTQHGGTSVLGAYSPHAGITGYVDYAPFAATFGYQPGAGGNGEALRRDAWRLAARAALARPGYHALRILGTITYHLVVGESDTWWPFGNLPYRDTARPPKEDPIPWSVLDSSKVLPAARQRLAARLEAAATPFIRGYQAVLGALFVAAMLLATRARCWSPVLIGAGLITRIMFHGVTVMQPRFLLPATPLELLALAEVARHGLLTPARRAIAPLLAGVGIVVLVHWAAPRLDHWVATHDAVQYTYRFGLAARNDTGAPGAARLDCVVDTGTLTWLDQVCAELRLLEPDPAPGDRAIARCVLRPTVAGRFSLDLTDPYAAGGLPDRIVLFVSSRGAVWFRHDLGAEPFAGHLRVRLGAVEPGTETPIDVELRAIAPDRDAFWGAATPVRFDVQVDAD